MARKPVRDIDRGYDKFKRQMMRMKRLTPYVAVGFVGESAWQPKEDEDGPSADVTVVDVATFNEFGTNRIPARPFVRTTFEMNEKKFVSIIRQIKIQLATGNVAIKDGLSLVGLFAQSEIQKTIGKSDSLFEPNAPSTIEKKGSSKPLIDTGQMRQSVTFEVRND